MNRIRHRRRAALSEHIADTDGAVVFRQVCVMGLEGIVAKRRGSRYRSGRCREWIKVKNRVHPAFERAIRFEQTHRFKITVTTAQPVAVRLTERIVVGDPPAVEANMTDVVDLNFLARQMDRLLTEMQSVRDDMRVLSAQVMRLDSSAQAMAQELGAISGLLAEQSPPSS